MNIRDKIKVSDIRCCPPHYLPHKFPVGEKVCDEPCHVHKVTLRMKHHCFFCKFLKCPNYKFMILKAKEMSLEK